uniref:Uncharacterized protein n=1 Tax=viral metagenome TaxID=1070528 RepID=A0A6C0JHP3_9ZZZZ
MGCTYSLEDRITAQHRRIAWLESGLPRGTIANAGSLFAADYDRLIAAHRELSRLEKLRPVPLPHRELSD